MAIVTTPIVLPSKPGYITLDDLEGTDVSGTILSYFRNRFGQEVEVSRAFARGIEWDYLTLLAQRLYPDFVYPLLSAQARQWSAHLPAFTTFHEVTETNVADFIALLRTLTKVLVGANRLVEHLTCGCDASHLSSMMNVLTTTLDREDIRTLLMGHMQTVELRHPEYEAERKRRARNPSRRYAREAGMITVRDCADTGDCGSGAAWLRHHFPSGRATPEQVLKKQPSVGYIVRLMSNRHPDLHWTLMQTMFQYIVKQHAKYAWVKRLRPFVEHFGPDNVKEYRALPKVRDYNGPDYTYGQAVSSMRYMQDTYSAYALYLTDTDGTRQAPVCGRAIEIAYGLLGREAVDAIIIARINAEVPPPEPEADNPTENQPVGATESNSEATDGGEVSPTKALTADKQSEGAEAPTIAATQEVYFNPAPGPGEPHFTGTIALAEAASEEDALASISAMSRTLPF